MFTKEECISWYGTIDIFTRFYTILDVRFFSSYSLDANTVTALKTVLKRR